MLIKNLLYEQRPRERLKEQGISVLSDVELISLILKSGSRRHDVFTLAQQVLSLLKKENDVVTLAQLMQIRGIGEAKASQILALFEFAKRRKRVRMEKQKALNPKDVFALCKHLFEDATREEFVVLYLDTKLQILGHEQVFMGTLDGVMLHPREIYFRAIKNLAHSIIVLHNHPSGDPQPSKADLDISSRLQQVGDLVGIPLLDHMIVGENAYWSYSEHS